MNYQHLLLVLLGSGLGGTFRFIVAHFHSALSDASKHFIPILLVNVIGSFLIGLAFALVGKGILNEKSSLFIITGFLGGFTTYSSFSLDTLRLFQQGEYTTALAYVLSTLVLGFLFVAFGFWLGKLV